MSSTRSFTRPAGDRHRCVASCRSRADRARAILGHYATKTSGGRTETTGKDSPREAWGRRLLPVCSGISCASWQGCVASSLSCQGAAQNQESLSPPSPLLPAGSGADLMATCCSGRDVATAAQTGPGSPPGNIDDLCLAPRKEAETFWEAAARAGCPDTDPGLATFPSSAAAGALCSPGLA